MSRSFQRHERRLAEYFYTRFPHRLDLKDVVAACHLVGEFFEIDKWKNVGYDAIRRWAKEGDWETKREITTGVDTAEPVPTFYHLDNDILRRRQAVTKALHHQVTTGRTTTRKLQAIRMYLQAEKDLEAQNVRREFFSDREPTMVMEAILLVAKEISREPVDRDQVLHLFETRYRQLMTRSQMALVQGGPP